MCLGCRRRKRREVRMRIRMDRNTMKINPLILSTKRLKNSHFVDKMATFRLFLSTANTEPGSRSKRAVFCRQNGRRPEKPQNLSTKKGTRKLMPHFVDEFKAKISMLTRSVRLQLQLCARAGRAGGRASQSSSCPGGAYHVMPETSQGGRRRGAGRARGRADVGSGAGSAVEVDSGGG